MIHSKKYSNDAFTLIELSIVIIIIGLLISGVLGAQSLINSAKLNSLVSQITDYKTAHNAFILEYDAISGDMDDAEDYELDNNAAGNRNTCGALSGSPTISNGNGNNILEDYGSTTSITYSGEIMNYFIMLSNANLIRDSLTYETGYGCQSTRYAGQGYPASEIGGGIMSLHSDRKLHFILGVGDSRNHSISNATEGNTANMASNQLSPIEAHKIDSKLDDSNPLTGIIKPIISYINVNTGNINNYGKLTFDSDDNSTNCIYNADYNKSYEEKACTIAIKID